MPIQKKALIGLLRASGHIGLNI